MLYGPVFNTTCPRILPVNRDIHHVPSLSTNASDFCFFLPEIMAVYPESIMGNIFSRNKTKGIAPNPISKNPPVTPNHHASLLQSLDMCCPLNLYVQVCNYMHIAKDKKWQLQCMNWRPSAAGCLWDRLIRQQTIKYQFLVVSKKSDSE